MTLTTWFISLIKRKKNKKYNCPYKMEPKLCGNSSVKLSDSSEKPSVDALKQGTSVLGKKTMTKSKMLWLKGAFIVLMLCLNACGSKVVLLKESDLRLLENGNYSVSPAWMEERLQFENNMVKRLQECHSNN